MHAQIYFGRHGIAGNGDFITPQGLEQAEVIRERLIKSGYIPDVGLTSPETRCVETGCAFVAPDRCESVQALHVYGGFECLDYPGTDPRRRKDVVNAADEILDELPFYKGERHVVIGHDSVPAVLAYRYLERLGGRVNWNAIPRGHQHLQCGNGIFVKNTELIFMPVLLLAH